MKLQFPKYLILALLAAVLAAVLVGCAGERLRDEGVGLVAEGRYEDGLAKLGDAIAEAPTSADFRKELLLQRAAVLEKLGVGGAQARQAGRDAEAELLYKRMLIVEPGNARAQVGLEALGRDRRHAEAMTLARAAVKSNDLEQAERLIRAVLQENSEHAGALALRRDLAEQQARLQASEPTLKSTYTKPINLEIRDANVKMIFESLARSTGINFILDKDVRPDLRTTVFLRNASIEDAIDLIVQTSQLKRKVLNKNTVLVYPNTAEKAKDYQELVVKGFYLQNADVKLVQTSLKALLKTKDMVVDEKLNLIVVRDTPEAIRLAEKLIAMHDLAEPEVMLEVEVLEVQRSRLLALGIQWPSQVTLTPLATGGGGLTLDSYRELNASRIGLGISPTTLNLRRDLSDANILANPRIRARNREKAKIMIGDKLPVVTTTTTATGLVSDSIQYLDVGIKLDVEPDVRLRDEVAIKVGLEVSSIAKEVRTPSGSLAYQVGTRNATTVLRLKDGETQILGGLISDQERSSAARIPLFGDIPILGRLFGTQQDDNSKSEIVLSITPRLIRNLALPDASNGEFWSGTEAYLRTKPLTLQGVAPADVASAGAVRAAPTGGLLSTLRAEPQAAAKSASLAWQGPTQVKTGEEFKLALRLKSDGALRGLPLQLGFDAKAFQVVNVVEGGFFNQNGGATSFSKTVDATAGKVFVSVARSESDGSQGNEVVLSLILRALPGASTGDVRVLLASPIIHGDKPPPIALPAPHVLTITP
ncbi:MAG: secretin N-terminal domain-containing protein [Sulfuritalea sp.]|nr:secretin N-terminal domain-containing protein [Sulfuritalea sp.]